MQFFTKSILICLALLASHASHAQPFEAFETDQALDFSMQDLHDKRHGSGDYRDKALLINFWASWCTPCIRELPELMQLQQQYSGKALQVITINVGESASHARQFAKSMRLDLPVLLDRDRATFKRWNGKVLPMSMLIDGSGTARYRAIGDPGWFDLATLEVIDEVVSIESSTGR
jgi:thiol-disulfide isomerase/thioredoxin